MPDHSAPTSSSTNGFQRIFTVEDFRKNMLGRLRDIGIPDLHQEHIRLVEIMVELYAEVKKLQKETPGQQDMDNLRKVIEELKGYATEHFKHEISFMTSIKFPELAAHQAAHQLFVEQLLLTEKRLWQESISYAVELMHMVVGWLFEHINQVDTRYVRFSRGEQLRPTTPLPRKPTSPSRSSGPVQSARPRGKTTQDFRDSLHNRLIKTGILKFDQEHLNLLNRIIDTNLMVEELYSRQPNPSDWKKIDETISALTDYCHSHFRGEEAWMSKINYPRLDQHVSEHQQLQKRLQEIALKLKDDRQVYYVVDFNFFLMEWLMTHTSRSDLLYAEYAKKNKLL
ncbi:MAG: hemerythrin family protein [Magnetococcales bacterium]|nr:hemerythrin family protein [Magnetococcales bacterium]